MNIRQKWSAIAGTVLVAGGLLAGSAFAAQKGNAAEQPRADRLEQAVKEGKLTQAEADLIKQLHELRHTYRQKFEADAKGLVDQAVKDGKITRAQADKLMHKGKPWGKTKNLSQDELKAKLAEAVKAGKLTQQQADRILQRFNEHQAKQNQQ
jgi:polyhydroxyalkanoate synthesis regulator phasin